MSGINRSALVTHFQQDECSILLDAIAHVEAYTSPFEMALQNVQIMLTQVVHFQVPPFENLMVHFYPQLKVSLANRLHEQEFVSLLVDVPLDIM